MRVKRGNVSRQRHKRLLKLAKGFRGSRKKIFRTANQAVMKSLKHAYTGRRLKRRGQVQSEVVKAADIRCRRVKIRPGFDR